MKNPIALSIILLLFISCCSTPQKKVNDPYSFFVAGHTYGKPLGKNLGLHPPFKKSFLLIKSHHGMKFGVLTGDLVRYSTVENWDSVRSDIRELKMPVYIAPGNHDITKQNLFKYYFGDTMNNMRTYRQFTYNDDLFIILDGNLKKWNIEGEQLEFFNETLEKYSKQTRNVFVFIHQVIWWDEDNEFRNIKLNWPPLTPDSTNYWDDIEPLLAKSGKPVFLFAGDLGAAVETTPFFYHRKNNIVYIGGGMGSKVTDNFIFVNINNKGIVNLELIALQGDPHRLGDLTDYKLP